MSDDGSPGHLDAYDEQVLELIAQHGVYLQAVFPTVDDPPGPTFVYTVGLSGLADPHPEFIEFGLPPEAAQSYLNHLAIDEVIKQKRRYQPGRLEGFFNGGQYDAWLLEVTDTTEHLTMANRLFASGAPVRALQLVWSDRNNRSPWEEGYEMDPSLQPLLGEIP